MNRAHPAFRLDMELLCALPKAPCFGTLEHLAMDLGVSEPVILALVDELALKRMAVCVSGHGESYYANIPVAAWKKIRVACEAYWAEVYEAETQLQSCGVSHKKLSPEAEAKLDKDFQKMWRAVK